MEVAKWFLVAALPFLFGVLYVRFLTVLPLKMSRYLLATTLVFVALVAILVATFTGWEYAIAIPLSLGLSLAGFVLTTRQILAREDPRIIPELTRTKGDPGLGHTAVVYFAHGEPETYDPIGWINQFNEFDEQGIPFVPLIARPYFMHRLRKSYLRVGKSDHRKMHQQMLQSLSQAFRSEGDMTTRFYLCFLDDDPRPDAAIIQALNEGASQIIVAEIFLTISNHTAEGKHLIEALPVADLGVPIRYTGPMYDSATLKRALVERVNRQVGETPKDRVGILLVGHGQPDEWDVEWPTETEQELGFRQEVLKLLEAQGYRPENLSLAWMEFKEPKPAEKVEAFARNGVEKVLYFSAAISADALHSQYDVPALVRKARVNEGFPLINLGAWNNEPLVIQAIREKIEAQMP